MFFSICLIVFFLSFFCFNSFILTTTEKIIASTTLIIKAIIISAKTNFITSIFREGELVISEEDDILVGAPEGSDFYISGMGGVLICQDGQIHTKQSKLGGII